MPAVTGGSALTVVKEEGRSAWRALGTNHCGCTSRAVIHIAPEHNRVASAYLRAVLRMELG